MKALTVVFDYGEKDSYRRLVKVLKNSWDKNSGIPLEVVQIQAPQTGDRHRSFYSNTAKLKAWREGFTEDTIFIDADMLCMKCPSDGFDLVDDIGVTTRPGPLPINGGVVFMKHTARALEFMEAFERVNTRMLEDPDFHRPWLDKYAGINQSAMGYLMENQFTDTSLLPGSYNCCDGWKGWKEAYLIHIKGDLRTICLKHRRRRRRRTPVGQIAEIWDLYSKKG